MSTAFIADATEFTPQRDLLKWSGLAWFTVAAIGQLAFIAFIAVFYGVSIFTGDFAAWNEKPLIEGHVEGDSTGNTMFAAHVLIAAVMTLSGLMQLVPGIRARAPLFHRISGRTFISTAILLAFGGLWLVWVRGTYLSLVGAVSGTLNALLIIGFAAAALFFAINRQIDQHKRWALRLFMVANGVWFLRVGMMAWMMLAGGPLGMNRTMSGPADVVLLFGCYLIPVAVLQLYFMAQDSASEWRKHAVSGVVFASTGVMALGIFGTVAFMWGPYW
ncbi:MAG: DUF2306 domain-containing protein [Pseudomonadota bacterium]